LNFKLLSLQCTLVNNFSALSWHNFVFKENRQVSDTFSREELCYRTRGKF